MRSFLNLAIIAALVVNISGAEFAAAQTAAIPACCVRAASHPHCAAMGAEAAPEPHQHSETSFRAHHGDCRCCVGLAPASGGLPAGKRVFAEIATSQPLAVHQQEESVSTSSHCIHGQRGPPAI